MSTENRSSNMEKQTVTQSAPPRNWLKNVLSTFAMFCLATIIAYAVGEIIVRIWFPQPMLPRYVTDTPYGIRINMPNLSIWHTSDEYHVNVRTNSHGVRSDREIPYEKPPGTFRILGLGDSFALGYEVDLEDTYSFLLEKKLHEQGVPNAEVINLGVSGFGTAEELLMLKNEGFRYSPDVVILAYFINDIENNITSDLYALNADTLQRKSATYLPAVETRKFLYSIPGYRFLAEHSQLLNIFRNRLSYVIQQGIYEKNKKSNPPLSGIAGDKPSTHTDTTTTLYEKELTARLLDEVYRECNRRGIPLLILNIPMAHSREEKIISNIPIGYMKCADSVMYVDAKDIVAPYHHKKEIHWERWHGHWRPWVHELVATVLADTLMNHVQRMKKEGIR